MAATLDFFPVGNGDMTLITTEGGFKLLIDINIRNPDDDSIIDVASLLKDLLDRDSEGRLFVDAFLLSHPDEDHCRGLEKHFHLGEPGSWVENDDKIIIREMWSSPIVFRRKNDVEGALCSDAEAWWKEARRRVGLFRSKGSPYEIQDADRILVLGEDKDGKTDDIRDIVVPTGSTFSIINGQIDESFEALLLAPILVSGQEAEELKGKNHSSTVLRFSLKSGNNPSAGLYLTGGDAEVNNWERIWERNHSAPENLSYNILQAPHHCSWHSLSHDSWSELGNSATVSDNARNALSQAESNALIISSSKEVQDDKNDPPCIRAKKEYQEILNVNGGNFLCTTTDGDEILRVTIEEGGPFNGSSNRGSSGLLAGAAASGKPSKAHKKGGGRYA